MLALLPLASALAPALAAAGIAVPGFRTNQSSLNPVGPAAAHIEHEFSLIFWITATVYILVLIALVAAVYRRRSLVLAPPLAQSTTEAADRTANRAIIGAMVVTVALLFVMLLGSFFTGHAIGQMNTATAIPVDVYGHQWWWEVQYRNEAEPYKNVVTANEIHIPVGIPIRLHGTSRDVIHSFWAPNVHGKRDLMPGYDTEFLFQVDQPGRWRGQCAEFCGEQHAHMSFEIVAEPLADFQRWSLAQTSSAVEPTTPQTQHGQQVFLDHGCIMCHAIRGTTANSHVGPDLTHLASRATIAAGTLPNNPGNLAGWILNAQGIKPGCRMPPNPLPGPDLQDLLAYLETLR